MHSIAARLTGYATSFLIAGTQVVTPLATALHARERHTQQQRLVLEGGKYCLALELLFFTLFVWLGQPLINLWMGPSFGPAWQLLLVLALGELLPMSQWLSHSTILGMGRHQAMGWLSIYETLATIGLALALVRPYGLPGVCVAVAVPGALCRGVCQIVYVCRLVNLPLRAYVMKGLLPAAVVAAPPALGLALATRWHQPQTWAELFGYGLTYGVCYLLTAAAGLLLFGGARGEGRGAREEDVRPSEEAAQPRSEQAACT
jgi:O-antigen/teichoic acid export membrane protein